MNKLYFIARTDVGAGSGEQRVFGAFDSKKRPLLLACRSPLSAPVITQCLKATLS